MRLLILLSLSVLCICGCSRNAHVKPDNITVSIPPIAYFINCLSDDAFNVNVMVKQAVGHSNYSPTSGQMLTMSESSAYLAVGQLDFELVWHNRLQSANDKMKWVDLSRGIETISGGCNHKDHHHANSSVDPHYWMSPKCARILVENLATELVLLKPEIREKVAFNKRELLSRIDSLDNVFMSLANEKPHYTFVVYHPALAYLARDYNMHQLVIENDGNAPTPAGMSQLLRTAEQNRVSVVFSQAAFDVNNSKTIAKTLGANIVTINPEGYDWMAEINNIATAIKNN